jgi:integrase/recombinase XerD
LIEPTDVTQPIVDRYQRWLFYRRQANGRPLTVRSQIRQLGAVKGFFRWMTRQHLTLFNPTSEIELPRLGRLLPRDVLTVEEAELLINQPDVTKLLGVRDRAIMETLYSTGIRRKELVNLKIYDLEPSRGTLMVREGKGGNDRVVPIGERARGWIDKYLTEVRPVYAMVPDEGYLFLTADGGPFLDLSSLSYLVHSYLVQAKIGKRGGCHIFRHTMASLMLENGADIRFIQEMLGHSHLSTTSIYTHVSIAKLRQIHQATHPAERKIGSTTNVDLSTSGDLETALDQEASDEESEDDPDLEPA